MVGSTDPGPMVKHALVESCSCKQEVVSMTGRDHRQDIPKDPFSCDLLLTRLQFQELPPNSTNSWGASVQNMSLLGGHFEINPQHWLGWEMTLLEG